MTVAALGARPQAAPRGHWGLEDTDGNALSMLGTIAHEESAHMSQRAVKEALAAGKDVVYDSSGDGGIDKLASKVQKMRDQGAKRVVANYATVDVETAIQRSDERAKVEGRYVPHQYIRDVHRDVAKTAVAAIERGVYDKLDVWDTTKIGGTAHIATYDREKGLVVHNEDLWNKFKERGK